MHSKYNWKKLTRYLSNESPEEEKKEIEMQIQSDETFAGFVQQMRQILSVRQKPLQIKDVDEKWNEIKADLLRESPKALREKKQKETKPYSFASSTVITSMKIWRYAAILIFAIGLSYFVTKGYLHAPAQQEEFRVLSVHNGERLTIKLCDGTSIKLDAGSELRYPAKFGNRRDVYLKGEGYFHVAHNAQKPFYVHVNDALVQDVGTRFNIRAWEENPVVTVTVLEGKVVLSRDEPYTKTKVLLTRNMQSTLAEYGPPAKPVNVNAEEYTRWMHNEIHFHDVSLKQILAQLERWYDFQFEVADTLLQKNHLDVHIKRTNVDNVIELLSIITKTNVIREGKKIRFVKRQRS